MTFHKPTLKNANTSKQTYSGIKCHQHQASTTCSHWESAQYSASTCCAVSREPCSSPVHNCRLGGAQLRVRARASRPVRPSYSCSGAGPDGHRRNGYPTLPPVSRPRPRTGTIAGCGDAATCTSRPVESDGPETTEGAFRDCLWTLAEQQFPSNSTAQVIDRQWHKWYRVNRDRIGANPDLLRTGMWLRVPAVRPTTQPTAHTLAGGVK